MILVLLQSRTLWITRVDGKYNTNPVGPKEVGKVVCLDIPGHARRVSREEESTRPAKDTLTPAPMSVHDILTTNPISQLISS